MPEEIETLFVSRIAQMSKGQLGVLALVFDALERSIKSTSLPGSNLATPEFVMSFGDLLKVHHGLSGDYLDKSRFEAGLERILKAEGRKAIRPLSRTNKGFDITVDGERWSLKTEGSQKINSEKLRIGKVIELGGDSWGTTDVGDLVRLRNRFLEHLNGFDRVFQLRYFRCPSDDGKLIHKYELVEIPKSLLLEAKDGELSFGANSRQNPRTGKCVQRSQSGEVRFQLDFVGAQARQLAISRLMKSLCVLHATWEFATAFEAESNEDT